MGTPNINDYLRAIKFGVEHEVLLAVDNSIFREDVPKLMHSQFVMCKKKNGNFDWTHIPITSSGKFYRYLLALGFALRSKEVFGEKHKFAWQLSYHGDQCSIRQFDRNYSTPLSEYYKASEFSPSWVVTVDNSVIFVQDPEAKERRIGNKDVPVHNETHTRIQSIEIVSPPIALPNIIYLDEVFKSIFLDAFSDKRNQIRKLVYYRNRTSSNHVHMTCGQLFTDPDKLIKIAMAWLYFEDVFMYLCQPYRRKNEYCISMREKLKENLKSFDEYHNYFFNFVPSKYLTVNQVIGTFQGNKRYVALNFHNLLDNGINTIECRLKETCSNVEELKNWVQLLAVFYCRALESEIVTVRYDTMEKLTLLHGNSKKTFKACWLLFKDFIDEERLTDYWGKVYYENGMEFEDKPVNIEALISFRKQLRNQGLIDRETKPSILYRVTALGSSRNTVSNVGHQINTYPNSVPEGPVVRDVERTKGRNIIEKLGRFLPKLGKRKNNTNKSNLERNVLERAGVQELSNNSYLGEIPIYSNNSSTNPTLRQPKNNANNNRVTNNNKQVLSPLPPNRLPPLQTGQTPSRPIIPVTNLPPIRPRSNQPGGQNPNSAQKIILLGSMGTAGKSYTVRKDKSGKKYIHLQKKKIYLKDIAGKYRYKK